MDSKNPLVLYSSSSEDEDQLNEKEDKEYQKELEIENHNYKKQKLDSKSLPPLPAEFLNFLEPKQKIENLNSKIRTVPHIEGNWATHVYIQGFLFFFFDIFQLIQHNF